jgi:hypothetical protein
VIGGEGIAGTRGMGSEEGILGLEVADIELRALCADRQEPFFERARSKGGFGIRASREIVQIEMDIGDLILSSIGSL